MERESFAGDDLLRPLSDQGRKKTIRAMEGLVSTLTSPCLCISSEATRALQTAEILQSAYNRKLGAKLDLQIRGDLNPGCGPAFYFYALSAPDYSESGTLVLVGHEPEISEFLSLCFYPDLPGGKELWDEKRREKGMKRLRSFLRSRKGFRLLEGEMFQIKKASASVLEMDQGGVELQALLPPAALRAMAASEK